MSLETVDSSQANSTQHLLWAYHQGWGQWGEPETATTSLLWHVAIIWFSLVEKLGHLIRKASVILRNFTLVIININILNPQVMVYTFIWTEIKLLCFSCLGYSHGDLWDSGTVLLLGLRGKPIVLSVNWSYLAASANLIFISLSLDLKTCDFMVLKS